ncbi:MAG: hypothetical protein ACT4OJ_09260 [Bacteroidota bacterium]
MKKLLLVLFSFSGLFAAGQKGINSLGAGVRMRFPYSAGSYSAEYRDIGPSFQAALGVTKLGYVQFGISSMMINLKNTTPNRGNTLTIFQTGYRSHFLNSGFFVQADGGLALRGRKNVSGGPVTSWIAGAGGGYSFKLSIISFLDISTSGNIMFNPGRHSINNYWIFGNAVYRFNLKKKK